MVEYAILIGLPAERAYSNKISLCLAYRNGNAANTLAGVRVSGDDRERAEWGHCKRFGGVNTEHGTTGQQGYK